MDTQSKYGVLLNDGIKLHRKWFEEMCKLLGIVCLYYAPRPGKHWTTYAEIKSNYYDPIHSALQTMPLVEYLASRKEH